MIETSCESYYCECHNPPPSPPLKVWVSWQETNKDGEWETLEMSSSIGSAGYAVHLVLKSVASRHPDVIRNPRIKRLDHENES